MTEILVKKLFEIRIKDPDSLNLNSIADEFPEFVELDLDCDSD